MLIFRIIKGRNFWFIFAASNNNYLNILYCILKISKLIAARLQRYMLGGAAKRLTSTVNNYPTVPKSATPMLQIFVYICRLITYIKSQSSYSKGFFVGDIIIYWKWHNKYDNPGTCFYSNETKRAMQMRGTRRRSSIYKNSLWIESLWHFTIVFKIWAYKKAHGTYARCPPRSCESASWHIRDRLFVTETNRTERL